MRTLELRLAVLALSAAAAITQAQTPTVFTVTNTNAGGPGSLVGVLAQQSQSCPQSSSIVFNIPAATDPNCNPSTGICRILAPDVVNMACNDTVLDGYSQPGAAPNSSVDRATNAQLKIELVGANDSSAKTLEAHGGTNGNGFNGSFNVTIRGLALPHHQVVLRPFNGGSVLGAGGGHVIAGNWFGWHADGTQATATVVSRGLYMFGAFMSGVRVGGADPADRNLFTYRNYAACCEIGSNGITGHGVQDVLIENNYVNVSPAGDPVATNGIFGGVILSAANGNGTPYSRNSIIRNNVLLNVTGGMGLGLAQGITVSRNVVAGLPLGQQAWSYFSIAGGGVRDPNPPVITGVTELAGEVRVFGAVVGPANATMRVEFFHNSVNNLQGGSQAERFVGFFDVTLDGSGNGSFAVSLPADTRNVTASATNLANGETSFLSLLNQPAPQVFRLDISRAGSGLGTVSIGNPSTFDCAGSCLKLANKDSVVTLFATPQAGSQFTGWSGDCSGTGSCTLTMSSDRSVTANFQDTSARYLVTSTAETGPGTLTAALTDLNANCPAGNKRIEFAIPAATDPGCNPATGVCVVQLEFFNGRNISCPNVLVDGYTQPGASPNSATGASNNAQLKIEFAGSGGFTINHDNVTMRGIAFAGVAVNVILHQAFGVGLVPTVNPTLTGNYFGWRADGLTPVAGPIGGRITINNGQSINVVGARIGGPDAADRNLITYAGLGDGIELSGSTGALVEGNLFNLDRNGNPVAGASTNNGISSNFGGNDANVIRRNVITRTLASGFSCTGGKGTTLTENEIYDVNLGADGAARGIRMVAGCNRDQFPPVITNVTLGAQVDVTGTLVGVASQGYRIEFFHNGVADTGNLGLGEEFAGFVDVTTDGNGNATFAAVLPAFVRNVSATATRLSTGDTSAFSNAGTPVGPFALSVTKAGSGSGTVTSAPAGIDCGATCTASFGLGTEVVLTAAPQAGSTFTGWSGDCTGTGTCTVTMNGARSVAANFGLADAAPQITSAAPASGSEFVAYSHTFVATGTGPITWSVASGTPPPGLTLAAATGVLAGTPVQNGTFNFTVQASGAVSPPATQAVALAIALNSRTLTVNKNGTGSGTVTGTRIDCGSTCTAHFEIGSATSLVAVPDADSTFTAWTGCGSSNGTSCALSMTQNRTVTVQFAKKRFTLTFLKTGTFGSVSSQPAGISCGSGCSGDTGDFDIGTTVTLTVNPLLTARFDGWSGACSGTDLTCTVTMDQAKTVSAAFSPRFLLSVAAFGSPSTGKVTSTPAGIDCPPDCGVFFDAGTVVQLVATPDAGAVFTGWGNACSGTGACTVTVNASTSVTATYAPGNTLTVTKAGVGAGTVTSNPAGINCGSTCTAGYASGTLVTLTATPAAGSSFTGWSGACTGTGACSVTMSQARAVTATFGGPTAFLNITVRSITGAPALLQAAGLQCFRSAFSANCFGTYPVGTLVRLVPLPARVQDYPPGTCEAASAGFCDVRMNADRTFTIDAPAQYRTLRIRKGDGEGTLTVVTSTDTFECPPDLAACAVIALPTETVRIVANPAAGHSFSGWEALRSPALTPYTQSGCGVFSNTCSFVLTDIPSSPGDAVVVAHFPRNPSSATGVATAGAAANARSARVGLPFTPAPMVIVRDAGGQPVSGVRVMFNIPASPNLPSAMSGGTVIMFTGADGIASAPVTANAVAGTWTLQANLEPDVPGVTSVNIAMTNTNEVVPIRLPGTGRATIPASGTTGVTLSVQVKTANGIAVPGANVRFSAPASPNAQGVPVPSATFVPPTVVTNTRGIARTRMVSNGVAGTFAVTVRATPPTGIPLAGAAAGFEGDDYVSELIVETREMGDAVVLDPDGDADGDGIPNAVEDAQGTLAYDKDNDVFGDSRLFAMQQYRDFLGREGEAGGVQFYENAIASGTTREQIIESFLASPEFSGGLPSVIRLYFSFFDRIPDYQGLLFQASALRQGTPLEAIAQNFYNSPEFTDRYGALSNDDYITLVYQNVLGRAPDAGGFAFYKNLLDSNTITKGQMMIGFSESPEFQQLTDNDAWVVSVYLGLLRRTPESSGLDFYVNLLTQGTPRGAVIPGFFNSPEYRGRFLP